MKKILYIWKDKYPWDVRVEKFCKTFVNSGYEVLLLCRWKGEDKEEEIIDGIKIRRVGFRKNVSLSFPLSINPLWHNEIKNSIALFNPNIIITREFFLTYAASRIGHRVNIPVIFDMAEHYPAAMKGWDKYRSNFIKNIAVHYLNIPEKLEKKAIFSSDGIITVSKELTNRLISDFKYSAKDIVEVQNTPLLSDFVDVRKGIKDKAIRFAYHGHFTNDRNLILLVRAFIKAQRIKSNITLFMAGDGETFSDIRHLIETAGKQNVIKLFGKYKQSDMIEFLSNTDVGILPYKNNEFINHIISNKLFDYLSCGKPVIVSEAKPMKRIIEETSAGISVDCNDINKLSDAIISISETDIYQLSENALRYSRKKYNWENDSKILLEFIERYI